MESRFNAGPTTPDRSPRVSHLDDKSLEPSLVAVCGISLRLPGGIRSTGDYWALLINGKDARGPIPPSRYNIDGFSDVLGGKGAIKARYGYFIDDDLSTLDTSFFSMTRKEVERCDPQQRQLLEVVKECLDAPERPTIAASSWGATSVLSEMTGCTSETASRSTMEDMATLPPATGIFSSLTVYRTSTT
jgi:hypothetical protein